MPRVPTATDVYGPTGTEWSMSRLSIQRALGHQGSLHSLRSTGRAPYAVTPKGSATPSQTPSSAERVTRQSHQVSSDVATLNACTCTEYPVELIPSVTDGFFQHVPG